MALNMLTFSSTSMDTTTGDKKMSSFDKRARRLEAWTYIPGLIMILLGTSIFLFPDLFVSIVAGCFIIGGLLLIQSLRSLRKAATRIRTQLEENEEEQTWESSPSTLLPRKVYTSYIN